MRTTAEKRHNDWKKAIRKRRIDRERNPNSNDYYDNLHQYSKNKIHCSCPMCSAKTNNKHKTGDRGWEPSENWSISDRRKIDEMNNQILDSE